MKILVKTGAVMAILLAIIACKDPIDDSPSGNPVTGLVIKNSAGSVIANGGTVTLKEGTSETFTATVTGAGATVSWRSSNTAIVSVSPTSGATVGVQAGNTAGSAEITVTAANAYGGVTHKINVTVSATVAVTGVSVKAGEADVGETLSLIMGTPLSLTAAPAPAGVQGVSYEWTANPAGIVTFSAANAATTTISAVAGEENETADITITAWNSDNTQENRASKTFTVTVQPAGYVEPAVTGLTLKIENTTINNNDEYVLDVDGTVSATVTLEPQGVIAVVSWTSGNTSAVTLESASGNSNTITAGSGTGQSLITISASNDSTATPVTLTFTVITVKHRGSLPWEWSQAADPWPGLSSGGTTNVFKSAGHPNVSVRAFGTNTDGSDGANILAQKNKSGVEWGGIRLGGMSGNTTTSFSGNGRLAIGLAGNTATTGNDTVSTVKGDFDLSYGPVKLTVEYKDLAEYQNRYVFRVYVNNNGTGVANSFLGNNSQIVSYNGKNSTAGDKIPDSPIVVLIDPSAFTEAQKAALSDAFIGLHAQNSGSADNDNGLTITRIKIEQINAAGITVNPEADFDGFPAGEFALSGSQTITLSGNFETVEWYVNGEKQSAAGKSFTLNAAGLIKGEHTLSVVVKAQGRLYSKSVKFTVGN